MKNKLCIFFILFFIPIFFVNALEVCEESDEHIKWTELSDEERKDTNEPPYCSSSYTSSNTLYYKKTKFSSINNKSFLSRYSSVDEGLVNPPEDQGSTGMCWAFASNSLVETAALKEGFVSLDFSEKHIEYSLTRDAFTDGTNTLGFNRDLDDGGNSYYAASYYFRGSGPILEEYMPTTTTNSKISISNLSISSPSVLIGNYTVEYYSDSKCSTSAIENIKSKVLEYGSVGISIYMNKSKYLNNGLYYYYNGSELSNHAVVIVGWDDTISASNFKNSPDQDGAFIVKNSWGTDFGDNGYFYISYSDTLLCSSNYNFSEIVENNYDYTYASTIGLANLVFSTGTVETSYYIATTFETNETTEYLDRISFEVIGGQSYEVFVSKENDLDESTWLSVGSGYRELDGVDTVTFDETAVSGNYKIIIKYTGIGYQIPLACKTVSDSYEYYYLDIPSDVNYYSEDLSEWNKMEELSDSTSSYYKGCVPIIFAYTKISSDDDSYYEINSITPSNDSLVYVGSSDYFIVSLYSENTEDDKFSYYIYDEDGNDVTDNFLVSGSASNGAYYIKQTENTVYGKYAFKLIYGIKVETKYFTILDTISSEKYEIDGYYIIVHDSGNKELTKEEFISNITFNSSSYKILDSEDEDITSSVSNIGTNMRLNINDFSYYIVYMGDLSGNGKIEGNDALLVSRYVVSLDSFSEAENIAADVSGNGKIEGNDALIISRYVVNLDLSL